ncbi:uncharacterized protein LAESUDRAFT_751995 [Laetiporus sulphureus 93-53]|uniref:Uncharacterized protein n=1 Tax=Laetiporus sulphureus 93-53 TaxID=1314785 RepID=A0A165CEF7_9APHY|nr:uncharacterized protein LAESUDRAFT_751995 [Laetiporus sulphureus 93-53]KZT02665.1 hypothetical protein LAESUDRAFT_751995 [Laetiporus sulphureus 93-53]
MSTVNESVNFVRNVKLAIPPPPPPSARAEGAAGGASVAAADEDTAAVVDSSVISFVGNLSGQQKSDVMNSSLFAQWAANAQYDRNQKDQAMKWYGVYKTTLENVGWIVQNFSFVDLSNASGHDSVDKAVLFVMEAFLGSSAMEAFKAMIDALKRPDTEGAYTLFKSHSWENTRADFQSGVCQVDQGKNAMWRIGCYDYETSGFDGDVLFYKFGSDSVAFQYSTQDMILNEEVYAMVRNEIIERLGDHAQDFVKNVPLKPPTRRS